MALAFAAPSAEALAGASTSGDSLTPTSRATLLDGVHIDVLSEAAGAFEPLRIDAPGARYIKLHFSRFSLPDGVAVEVSSADGAEVHRYANGQLGALTVDHKRGDDGINSFYAMSVTGDAAVIRILGRLDRLDPDRHGVLIDAWLQGPGLLASQPKPAKGTGAGNSHIETTCGVNQRYDARCYADSHPGEYDRSIPVALLITSSGEECTAWRVGPDNRMFTAEHCVSGQDDLDGSEIWFHYRAESCGSKTATQPVKVTGGQLLALDKTLDFALFTVNDFASIAYLGHLGLDVRNGVAGEGIFIPQHGLGRPKQIALESDMNSSGLCEIDDADHHGYAKGSDLGYFCDTTTSSSGSPVVARATGKVIALHHLGGCFNSGSKVSLIWPKVSSHFSGVVPQGDNGDGWDPGNQMPEAQFSYACDQLACSFDGSGSADSDGSIAGYSWNFGDGASAAGMTVEHEFYGAGSYAVTLTVQDDEGATDSYSKNVSVSLPNAHPDAKFSLQCQDNACDFNGAGSSDPDGHIVSWNWKFGDGSTGSGVQTSHQYAAAGTYSITLTVKDDAGASDSQNHTVTLSMPNQVPLANFSVNCDALDCSADATGSADPDGQIVAFHWMLGDGQAAAGSSISHSYAQSGTYTLTLTVEDDAGATATASRTVSVQSAQPEPQPEPQPAPPPLPEPDPPAANQAPAARFTSQCSHLVCSFDAGASSDSDGQITAYSWSFGDGQGAAGSSVVHEYAAQGQYHVTLRVADDAGATDATWRYVTVTLPAAEPAGEFSVACEDLDCTLDAGSGTDDGGTSANYDWSFGDGETGQGRTVTHRYAANGVYQVTLKVTDGDRQSSTRSRTVAVVSTGPIMLEATGGRLNDRGLAILKWARASTDSVVILRNGKPITQVANTGKYVDMATTGVRKAARYQVCDALGERCSKEITVLFAPARGSKYPAGQLPHGRGSF